MSASVMVRGRCYRDQGSECRYSSCEEWLRAKDRGSAAICAPQFHCGLAPAAEHALNTTMIQAVPLPSPTTAASRARRRGRD
jgi:hypothetical protein